MKTRPRIPALLLPPLLLLLPALAGAQRGKPPEERYDCWRFEREMIRHGVQAVLMCNGLFTSHRTLEQVFSQELAYVREPVGTARGGDYELDRGRQGFDRWDLVREVVEAVPRGGPPEGEP